MGFGIELKFGFLFDPYGLDQTVTMAKLAEKYGFDTCFLADEAPSHPYRDPYVSMTAIVLNTRRVKTGTAITPVYTRHAALVAVAFRSIEELAPGRTIVGLGPGGSLSLHPLGIQMWKQPIAAVRESVQIVRQMFQGGDVDFKGKVFETRGTRLFRSARKIPIYLGARGPQMLRLSGEVADGCIMTSPTEYLGTCMDRIGEGARRAGRSFSDVEIVNSRPFSIMANGKKAREMIKPWCTFFFINLPRDALQAIGFTERDQDMMREVFYEKGIKAASELVTEKMIDALPVAGTPEDCVEKVLAEIDAGVSHVLFGSPLGPRPVESVKLIGTSILPNVKKALRK